MKSMRSAVFNIILANISLSPSLSVSLLPPKFSLKTLFTRLFIPPNKYQLFRVFDIFIVLLTVVIQENSILEI